MSEIVELVNSAYRGESSRQGWTTEASFLDGQRTDAEKIIEVITTENSVLLTCQQENAMGPELVGVVNLVKKDRDCYLGMLTVKPNLQTQGIGKQLMEASEKWAREQGCLSMSMTVITLRSELIAFYERRGFKRSGFYEPFPYGDERFGLPKRPDLQFEVLTKSLR